MTVTTKEVMDNLTTLAKQQAPGIFIIYGTCHPEKHPDPEWEYEGDLFFGWGMEFFNGEGVFFYRQAAREIMRGDSVDDILNIVRPTADVRVDWLDEGWLK